VEQKSCINKSHDVEDDDDNVASSSAVVIQVSHSSRNVDDVKVVAMHVSYATSSSVQATKEGVVAVGAELVGVGFGGGTATVGVTGGTTVGVDVGCFCCCGGCGNNVGIAIVVVGLKRVGAFVRKCEGVPIGTTGVVVLLLLKGIGASDGTSDKIVPFVVGEKDENDGEGGVCDVDKDD